VRKFFAQTNSVDRLNAITDGVYAIVITILVLDLKIPEIPGLSEMELLADLRKQISNFIAYFISFIMVAFFWMRHHWVFKPLDKVTIVHFV
jgi:uncharacterized membrane protein